MTASAPRSAFGNRALDDSPERVLTYYDLPLTLDTTVRITGPFPLTKEEFERMQLLLYVMAEGLTQREEGGLDDAHLE
jgi:hypothetical protein